MIRKMSRFLWKCFLISLICLSTAHAWPWDNGGDRGVAVQGMGASGSWGDYYALIVGINDYREWPSLRTAVKDATVLKEILVAKYGFPDKNVILRTNEEATRLQFLEDLENMARRLKKNDNLLIYFAGHGQLHDIMEDGFWIPVEGALKRPGTWVANSAIKSILTSEKVEGKNIVVIADSCYSGNLLRGGPTPLSMNDDRYEIRLGELASKKSRQVITSGGVEPVADSGRDGHSLFAYYFLKSLKENDRKAIDLENLLITKVWKDVTEIGGQRPCTGRLKTTMDEGGQFVLASSGAVVYEPPGPAPVPTTGTLRVSADVSGARIYIDGTDRGNVPITLSLDPKTYRVEVKRSGYDSWRTNVTIEAGRTASLMAYLTAEKPKMARLFVNPTPSDATIRILNIGPVYERGMELDPGSYHVEVSKDGYETDKRWVELAAGEDKYESFRLEKSPEAAGGGPSFTNSLGMKFVRIPAGTFMMGSPSSETNRDSDETQHRVTLTRPFYMQTTEVTQGQWKAVMGNNPSNFSNCGDSCPVEKVSWDDCQEFIRKLNQKEGTKKYRLPTEAEWEYACRAGTTTTYFWGNSITCSNAMYENDVGSSEDKCVSYVRNRGLTPDSTAPVMSYSPNAWGLYDMHGNVWEWCSDWYRNYPSSAVTDPEGPSSGAHRVLRGGSWCSYARYCRSANRSWCTPDGRSYDFGFRLVRDF